MSNMIVASPSETKPLECIICHCISLEPYRCIFCKVVCCVECCKQYGKDHDWKCPNSDCKSPKMVPKISIDVATLQMIQQLPAKCPKQCGKTGTFATIVEHAPMCGKNIKDELLKTQRDFSSSLFPKLDTREFISDDKIFVWKILASHFKVKQNTTFTSPKFRQLGYGCKMTVEPYSWESNHGIGYFSIYFDDLIRAPSETTIKITVKAFHKSDKKQDVFGEYFISKKMVRHAHIDLNTYIEKKDDMIHPSGYIYLACTMELVSRPSKSKVKMIQRYVSEKLNIQ